MSSEEFYNTTISEISLMMYEYNVNKRLQALDQASYNAALVMNTKAVEVYNSLRNSIIGEDKKQIDKDKIEKYKTISIRLKLKYPTQWGDKNEYD